ncbi:hypothetical protein MBLNU230_g7280t1 [Neophaeotheca triangularis]
MFNLVLAGIALALIVLSQYLYTLFFSPLSRYPGPTLARLTDWFRYTKWDQQHTILLEQHRRHGAAVRYGPNLVSIADASLIPKIYGSRLSSAFVKSDFYSAQDVMLPGGKVIQNVFGVRNKETHRGMVAPIHAFYNSHPRMLALQPRIDETLTYFCGLLEERFVKTGKTMDLGAMMKFYAYDVASEFTFSKRIGMLDAGHDINSQIESGEKGTYWMAQKGQMGSRIDWPATKMLRGYVNFSSGSSLWAVEYCMAKLGERFAEIEEAKTKGVELEKNDFLDFFVSLKNDPKVAASDVSVLGWSTLNVLASGDTTAITLNAILYNIIRNPRIKNRLVAELDATPLSFPSDYTTALQLPYLDACIQEGTRTWPGVSGLLERIVGPEGLILTDGSQIPPGTIVGMNPYVVQRTEEVFGEDRDEYVPERWLRKEGEGEEEFAVRSKKMRASILSFGAGSRVCLGKRMAMLEVTKTISTLLKRFEFELVDPKQHWTHASTWFSYQIGECPVKSPQATAVKRRLYMEATAYGET